MSVLKLKLLGQIECVTATQSLLALSTRKSEVLLAYLALAPGIRHPRERLINLLWSDRAEEQARNSLRQSLSSIKKSLEATTPLLLEVERTTVRVDPDQIQVDALEFEQLAANDDIDSLTRAQSALLAETEDPNLAVMRQAIFRLQDDYREPLVLQVLMGHSTKEIAELMGINPGAVLTRLHRARIKLKDEVQKEDAK